MSNDSQNSFFIYEKKRDSVTHSGGIFPPEFTIFRVFSDCIITFVADKLLHIEV